MIQKPLVYLLPDGLGELELSPTVLTHFSAHRQTRHALEAGGHLFAEMGEKQQTRVIEVTGPRPTDRRSPFGYRPDRKMEKAEIADRYKRGLHFVGDWHTHRQINPTPSVTDKHTMLDLVNLSSYDLAGFILVIVGLAAFPDGLHVSFHTKTSLITLTRIERE